MICKVCKIKKSLDNFYHSKTGYFHKSCSICESKRKKANKITNYFQARVNSSKTSDRKRGYYDKINHIDKDYCLFLEEQQEGKCVYCDIYMTKIMSAYCRTDYSIERIDNSVPHIKSNCVLACWGCNLFRGDNCSFEEFKILMKVLVDLRSCN